MFYFIYNILFKLTYTFRISLSILFQEKTLIKSSKEFQMPVVLSVNFFPWIVLHKLLFCFKWYWIRLDKKSIFKFSKQNFFFLVQNWFSIKTRMNFFTLICRSQQFSEAYAKNVTNFSMSNLHLWALITYFKSRIISCPIRKLNLDYRSFISCGRSVVIHTICVNNMDNPKIKAFNSCFFVHEARHVFFSSVKNWWF